MYIFQYVDESCIFCLIEFWRVLKSNHQGGKHESKTRQKTD